MNDKIILVVEDNEFDRKLVCKALGQKHKFNFIEAENGDACLEILKNQKVDLILMDIMMPGKFGTQILTTIREKFNPLELPIIMVTAKSEAADIIGCLQNGANDYITKPINFEVAVHRILTHLRLADFSRAMAQLKEFETLDSLTATYNHEINNPLAIAIGCANSPNRDEGSMEKIKKSLWRIADIVKKISEINDKKVLEYSKYSDKLNILKVK